MDIQHKWVFSVKDFVQDVSKIESGEYLQKLQEMVIALSQCSFLGAC